MYNKKQDKMNKETLRMQMLAGIITESQYKEKLNEETSDEKIERYEKYSYTLDGENITPDEIAFYDNILKAEIDGKLYNLKTPDENGVVELNPTQGKIGSYT